GGRNIKRESFAKLRRAEGSTVMVEDGLDQARKRCRAEWLGERWIVAEESVQGGFVFGDRSGDEEDRGGSEFGISPQFGGDFIAIVAGEVPIQDNEVGPEGTGGLEDAAGAILLMDRVVAGTLQDQTPEVGESYLVVHEEDAI